MKRKHNYLVGYEGEGQCIYGLSFEEGGSYNFTDLMTLPKAKREAKKFSIQNGQKKIKAVVYKLVKVKA